MGDIVVSEVMHVEALKELQGQYKVNYDPDLYWHREALMKKLQYSQGLIVRNQTKVSREIMDAAPQLRVIGRLGAGLDNIDLEGARERGIEVVYAPAGNSLATAEHTMALILALARKLADANGAVKRGVWDRKAFTGIQIAGKTLGVVGYGHVGKLVAKMAENLGMEILVTRQQWGGIPASSKARQVPLVSLLSKADFVSLHLPLTPLTDGLIDGPELALMKAGAFLINTSRGRIVREKALVEALSRREIAGAALDVRENEPALVDPVFYNLPNVLLTPHIGGWTREAQERVAQTVAKDVFRVLAGQEPDYPYRAT